MSLIMSVPAYRLVFSVSKAVEQPPHDHQPFELSVNVSLRLPARLFFSPLHVELLLFVVILAVVIALYAARYDSLMLKSLCHLSSYLL